MLAIFKREFKSYFQTVIGWLFLAVSIFIYGLYYYVYNFVNAKPDVAYPVSSVIFICLVTIPILSMRCLADEKRTKTDQLILTSPVTVGKMVIGKFLALAAILTIVALVYCISPLVLLAFGKASLKVSYVAILGYWLYGLTCIAICVFASALTESQVIAAVLSFLFLFAGYMMSSICGLISSTGNILTKILGCYDLTSSLDDFFNGIINVKGIIYYLSLIGLFLFFASQVIQKRRWTITKKSWKTGAFSTGYIAIVLALVVVVNGFVGAVPSKYTKLDMTQSKMYTLTEETEKFLKNVKEDIDIYVLAKEKTADSTLAETLRRIAESSDHIKLSYKDPAVSPNFYTKYTKDTPYSNSVIVASGKRSRVVSFSDIYTYETDQSTYQQSVSGYDGEGKIVSAIAYVENDQMPKVYTLTGHGETDLSGTFSQAFEKSNLETESINLLKYDAIPDDAAGLIINGPTADFSKDDVQKVQAYFDKGGKAIITLSYQEKAELKNFYSLLKGYGVQVADGMVVETNAQNYAQMPFYLIPEKGSGDLLSNCGDNYLFVPMSLGMTHDETKADSGITITDLLTTTEDSYAKKNIESTDTYDKTKNDQAGPFQVALEVVKSNTSDSDTSTKEEEKAGDTDLMLFGSTTMFTDDSDSLVAGNNLNLFNSCIAKFQNEDTANNIVIPVKAYNTASLTVTAGVSIAAAVVVIVAIPLILLGFGFVIWTRRRKR